MHTLGKFLLCAGALVLFAGTATVVRADETFTMTWTGAYGPGDATLTGTPAGLGPFDILAISGEQNGVAITGLSSYGNSDNVIFPDPGDLVDFSGLAFSTTGGTDYNIFLYTLPDQRNTYTECNSTVALTCTGGDVNNGIAVATLAITLNRTPAPEPGALILLSLGLIGLIAVSRRGTRSTPRMLS